MTASLKGLGFIPGKADERDWRAMNFLPRIAEPRQKGTRWWYNPLVLDQGREGSCVGHAWTQSANAAPRTHKYDHPFAYALYKRAQELDEWAGTDYEGTSVRAGAKAAKEKGLITGYAFIEAIDELAYWLLNFGTVVIGVDWFTGMDDANERNGYYIKPTGVVRGGHALILDGIRFYRDSKDFVRLLNSWGKEDYGYGGRAKMLLSDLERLLFDDPYSAACTSIEAL